MSVVTNELDRFLRLAGDHLFIEGVAISHPSAGPFSHNSNTLKEARFRSDVYVTSMNNQTAEVVGMRFAVEEFCELVDKNGFEDNKLALQRNVHKALDIVKKRLKPHFRTVQDGLINATGMAGQLRIAVSSMEDFFEVRRGYVHEITAPVQTNEPSLLDQILSRPQEAF